MPTVQETWWLMKAPDGATIVLNPGVATDAVSIEFYSIVHALMTPFYGLESWPFEPLVAT